MEEVLNAVACCDAQAIKNGLKVYKNAQLMVTVGTKPIRAFSFYDRFGPFFDWVSVNWKVGQHYRQAPAKLLLIFEDTDRQFCAIVHGCRWQTKEQINQSTFITERWELEMETDTVGRRRRILRKIYLREIMDVKFVVEHDGDTNAFHGLCDRQLQVGKNVVDVVEPRYAWAYPSFKSGSKIRPNCSRYLCNELVYMLVLNIF